MYILKLWNQLWGDDARFVAYDPQTKEYTEFSPVNAKDAVWTSQDLTALSAYNDWEDCSDEPIYDLEDAII